MRRLREEIEKEDEDEVFTAPDAAAKWAKDKIARDAERKAWRAKMDKHRDPYGDAIVESLYAAGDRI